MRPCSTATIRGSTISASDSTTASDRPAPRRIAVIGNAGTGKSTLAVEIGRRLGIEVMHLDRMLWGPGWRIADEEEFERRHAALLERESWVIDGLAYPSTIESRIKAAEAVVFTRYGLWRCYWWSLKRALSSKPAAGRPDDCLMLPALIRLARAIWRAQREAVPEIERLLRQFGGGKAVYVLRSPRDAPALLHEVGGWRGGHTAAGG